MLSLGKLCPGENSSHVHSVVAGSDPCVGAVSRFAGKFVKAVLNTIPSFRNRVGECLAIQPAEECVETEVLVSSKELKEDKPDSELRPIIAHPSNSDLVRIRILKHGQASEQALRLAREHHCDFCKSNARPHTFWSHFVK